MLIFKIGFFLSILAPGKRMCYDSSSTNYWVLPWHNAWAPRLGFQQAPSKTDAAHTSMTPPFFFFNFGVCVFCDVFDGAIIRFLKQWPQKHPYWKPPPLRDIWWKSEVAWIPDVPSSLSYICEGSNNPLLETG